MLGGVNIGDRVRIQRDETRYPSKGTWPQFRGKTGTIVEINLGEYGVCFGKVTPRKSRPGSFDWDSADVAWFRDYELSVISRRTPTAALGPGKSIHPTRSTSEALTPV